MSRRTWREPFGAVFVLALGLLPLGWLGLNAGPWNLTTVTDVGTFGGIRAIAPGIVLLSSVILLWRTKEADRRQALSGPTGALLAYGAIAFVATLLASPDRPTAAYWGLSFLSVPAVALVLATSRRPDLHLRIWAKVTWGITVGIAVLVLGLAIWSQGLVELLASGELDRIFGNYEGTIAPALAINANGAGRFAGLGVLIALSAVLVHRWKVRTLPWVLVLVSLAVLLAYTQSRGSVVAFLVASAILLALHTGWRFAAGTGLGLGVGVSALVGPGTIWSYLARGQSAEQLSSLTGRTGVWGEAARTALGSPMWGYGFHADRLVLGAHVHDAWLHALIQGGAIGLVLFAAAWILAFNGAIRAGMGQRFQNLPPRERSTAILASVTLVFLLVRSIPESTAAFYGVDLLIFVPLAAYLHALGGTVAGGDTDTASAREGGASLGSDAGRRRVLACAFACAPPGSPSFRGGEDLLGWRLVEQLGERHNVHVLTSAEHRESIDAHRMALPPRVTFHYIGLPSWMDGWRERQGWHQLHAYLWQIKAYLEARRLTNRFDFDLFHHITYANDWMASYPGAFLDLPYIRGPGGGAQQVPTEFQRSLGRDFQAVQGLRRSLQRLLRKDPVFWMGQERARTLLACNEEVRHAIPERWRHKTHLFPVNGIQVDEVPSRPVQNGDGPFTITTAGKLLRIKGFDLALEAFSVFAREHPEATFHIIGEGPERRRLEACARELGIHNHVRFEGWLDRGQVLRRMAESDAFLFPSLRDGGGAVVVEAMAVGTPVVCLDLGGPGMHVTEESGFAVPAHAPDRAVEDLAEALDRLATDPALWDSMSSAARERAIDHYRWDSLGNRLDEIYTEAINHAR